MIYNIKLYQKKHLIIKYVNRKINAYIGTVSHNLENFWTIWYFVVTYWLMSKTVSVVLAVWRDETIWYISVIHIVYINTHRNFLLMNINVVLQIFLQTSKSSVWRKYLQIYLKSIIWYDNMASHRKKKECL